jgi:hypothetical protein
MVYGPRAAAPALIYRLLAGPHLVCVAQLDREQSNGQ